nr:MAG TPA: hypothetical protein [Caudoviricetes sp.]
MKSNSYSLNFRRVTESRRGRDHSLPLFCCLEYLSREAFFC